MKLSMSNIGWEGELDAAVYTLMKKYGYVGLEIAPTRIFPESPYENLDKASTWSKEVYHNYGLRISSMQSIWFGKKERLFGNSAERQILIDYTRRAIDFAVAINCKNLVFGCPRNRNAPAGVDLKIGIPFFKELGDYAASKDVVIGIEANPPIYNTNYINDTFSALNLIEQVCSEGFMLNLDIGTIIHNKEDISKLIGKVHLINHVHISEPGLKPIQQRQLHHELKQILQAEKYMGYISIEVSKAEDILQVNSVLNYIREVFA